jgi:hypothetical protein
LVPIDYEHEGAESGADTSAALGEDDPGRGSAVMQQRTQHSWVAVANPGQVRSGHGSRLDGGLH